MKYLYFHKIIWALLVLVWLIIDILYFGFFYILYVIWNFKIPHDFWLEFHSGISSWNNELITDKTPAETFVRRYNFLMIDYEYNVNDTGIYLIINNYSNI